jgi:transcriptional regulator with XRE-family HTH domain
VDGTGVAQAGHERAARRLRAAREQRKIGVRELARRVGISPSLVSQIETGKAMPSVSTLYAIVSELDVSLDALFKADEPSAASEPPAAAPVVREAGRRTIELESGVTWQRLTADEDPHVDFLHVIYDHGGSSAVGGALMRHAGREYGYVISGRLEVTLQFDRHELGPGESISFDSTVPHLLRNLGDEPVHAVWVVVGRRGGPPEGR